MLDSRSISLLLFMPIKLTLKVELAKKEMTQKELAKKTGIRPPTISAICTNSIKHLPIDVIGKICETLECQPGDWIKFKSIKNNKENIY